MEAPMSGSPLPESSLEMWHPRAHHPDNFSCLLVCRTQQYEDEATLCAGTPERGARSFSVVFKRLMPFLLHFISDAESRKYHPFKTTVLYFWCYDINSRNYDVLPLQIAYILLSCYIHVHSQRVYNADLACVVSRECLEHFKSSYYT